MKLPKLHAAILKQDVELVKKSLQDSAVDVNKIDIRTDSPLILAAIGGNVEIFKMLIERDDIDINYQNRYGENAFYHSIYRGHTEIVKMIAIDSRLNFIGSHNEDKQREVFNYISNI